jgi:hypothetical protein
MTVECIERVPVPHAVAPISSGCTWVGARYLAGDARAHGDDTAAI